MGASGEASSNASSGTSVASARTTLESGIHDRERLVLAPLPFAQQPHRSVRARIDHQVEAADALDRHDRALADGLACCAERGVTRRRHGPGRRPELEVGSTRGARRWLGVEAAIARIVELGPAPIAEREALQGGPRAVVRKRFEDRVSRSTVRAVREGIAVASIRRIEQLAEAVSAGRDVGQDGRGGRVGGVAVLDHEGRQPAPDRRATASRNVGSIPWMAARGGSSRGMRCRNDLTASAGPSTSQVTPAGPFRTQPVRSSSTARR